MTSFVPASFARALSSASSTGLNEARTAWGTCNMPVSFMIHSFRTCYRLPVTGSFQIVSAYADGRISQDHVILCVVPLEPEADHVSIREPQTSRGGGRCGGRQRGRKGRKAGTEIAAYRVTNRNPGKDKTDAVAERANLRITRFGRLDREPPCAVDMRDHRQGATLGMGEQTSRQCRHERLRRGCRSLADVGSLQRKLIDVRSARAVAGKDQSDEAIDVGLIINIGGRQKVV